MSYETELKLAVSENQLPALKTLPFWKKFALNASETFHLGNIYFDTADRALNKASAALRVRTKNGAFFQTLKTKGSSVNGLTKRGEWEWPIDAPELDLKGLRERWPESLGEYPESEFQPLFSTDFDRTRWYLNWAEPSARVEVVLDDGFVKSGDLTSRICELEIELLEGDEAALFEISKALQEQMPLQPSDKSKAERGFELLRLRGLA
ncbi:hypothetical protein EOPP23_06040 [Endozoicomonas sp. OPT23]|uniref:CYTH domain-containing protein n=1 Tax=Endozoicomonas sp. OPT23 TaxID=2072845 RepID=UPI00129A8D3E|nr:CYTH domain-containing protein [Endozoicomonas sp. OPT23]MRI32545.1 hypothetical protein [Endozoicomonas sp. OPT23]